MYTQKENNTPKEILELQKQQHPDYDPKWLGSNTYGEKFVLKAIEKAISLSYGEVWQKWTEIGTQTQFDAWLHNKINSTSKG